MKDTRKIVWKYIVPIVIALLTFLLCWSQILYSFDKIFSDMCYQTPTTANKDIAIIAIDEKTLQEYGKIETWSRSRYAQLIEILNQNEQSAPSAIVMDIIYAGTTNDADDKEFAEACKEANNVITAVDVVRKAKVTQGANGLYVDNNYVETVEFPYEALKQVTDYGFANTIQDTDGYIRYALTKADYKGEEIPSLAICAYKHYCESRKITMQMPDTDANGVFGFTFTGKSGAYEIVSMLDVMQGKVDVRAFADRIVLVGVYAPGLQDAYNVAVQKGAQMYGVEIHANILEAVMEGKTALPVNSALYALICTIIVVGFYFLIRKLKIRYSILLLIALIILDVVVGKVLYLNGFIINIVELPIVLLLTYVVHLIYEYLAEVLHKRKVLSAFKKYVAPQVVEEISKKGDFQIALGGENRHIAVLFVDIRGFTPMSESLQPEEVVGILNEYLNLTTDSIFKNGGTLDKFIGDATMAVFNAPFDLDDYIYKAVCTAKDIASGSAELQEKLQKRFGKTISFGIGVNCGNAVVGNIGCEARMDYTAIGDTVNTAARLESNAKPGQILISQDVYEQVKERVQVTEVGVIPLKGKSNGVFVYSVDEVL